MRKAAQQTRQPGADRADEPLALHDRAMQDLRYIRQTMERAGPFTAVPGVGGMVMGVVALAGAVVASRQASPGAWLATWLVVAVLGAAVAAFAMERKARGAGVALLEGSGRRFALSFAPPLAAAVVLTAVFFTHDLLHLLPGTWILLYGASVMAAGTYSVRVVPVMGACFMVAGLAALFTPAGWGNAWMAVSFGGLQLGFGAAIARRHGG
jgi:hypothetical protein